MRRGWELRRPPRSQRGFRSEGVSLELGVEVQALQRDGQRLHVATRGIGLASPPASS